MLKVFNREKITWLAVILLAAIGLFYRVYGLNENYSFWSDEAHVSVFSRAILQRGHPVLKNGYTTRFYQCLIYWTTAVSMWVFGINEFASRFPSVVFGTLTIIAIYCLGKEIFNRKTGLLACFLTSLLTIEILWSRQARPYQALQFFFVLVAIFLAREISAEKTSFKNLLTILIISLVTILFHVLGLVIVFCCVIILSVLNFAKIKKFFWFFLLFLAGLFILFLPSFRYSLAKLFTFNNFFYYRVFLVHNYPILVVLTLLAFLLLILDGDFKKAFFFAIFLGGQTFAISFFQDQPFTRYFYPVFPFIILLSSYAAFEIGGKLSVRRKHRSLIISAIMAILLVLVLLRGRKMTYFPIKAYSLNVDMQEIPEVDWKKIYAFVENKKIGNPHLILVTNWGDLPVWYLGEGRPDYLVRKESRAYDPVSSGKIINSLAGFIDLIKINPRGIVVIDSWDDLVADGMREYCRDNLKKEMEIDRLYPIQPRYWPVTVYSWGM